MVGKSNFIVSETPIMEKSCFSKSYYLWCLNMKLWSIIKSESLTQKNFNNFEKSVKINAETLSRGMNAWSAYLSQSH